MAVGMSKTHRFGVALAAALAVGAAVGAAYFIRPGPRHAHAEPAPPPHERGRGTPSPLPLPSTLSLPEYEAKLFAFLNAREYVKLGWARDKAVRDTGPYIDGTYYGTHPAVRIYYSPGIIKWLEGGRAGTIPDGEMVIKEQYAPPAARHRGKPNDELWGALESWTVMVKDSRGSHDGWFWSNPGKGQKPADNYRYPFDYPASGFGLYCVRCHAAAHSPGAEPDAPGNEYLFASLRNVEGYPGEPILFRVDDSWRDEKKPEAGASDSAAHPKCGRPGVPDRAACKSDAKFLTLFPSVKPVARADVAHLPPVTHDRVVPRRDRPGALVTSDQCMNCHAGLMKPYGPSMFVPFGKGKDYGAPGWDVSPHGEWRWTPMGLAGRDPVFHAQLELEMKLIDRDFGQDAAHARQLRETLTDACLKCHGAMGRHQFAAAHKGAKFSAKHVLAKTGETHAEYGALAREGISCAVCHRMQQPEQPAGDNRSYLEFFLNTSVTGNFRLGPPGEVYGPFNDDEISPYAMQHATGMKPKHSPFLRSSQLCATCHAVVLPVVDKPCGPDEKPDELIRAQSAPLFQKFHHHVEQATYLEWLNSEFENEVNRRNPKAKTCQDCHMAQGLKDERHGIDLPRLKTRIAAIQDETYPEAENLAPHDKLTVRLRENGYRRHNFAGLNAFLLELFNQHDDVLGVRKTDFMTGSKLDLGNAIENMLQTAQRDTANLEVTAAPDGAGKLTAKVTVRNKTGHRFPTGVGFRRAFIELAVVEAPKEKGGAERVLWASGRTNEWGVIVGADGKPLLTEFFDHGADGRQRFQPHHDEITSPEQVQVYESLLIDSANRFTTSFVRGCETAKDNRLLPRGWKQDGPGGGLAGRYLQATHPVAEAARDPRYADGSGSDEVTYRISLPAGTDASRLKVRATLYYQSMPPYFLRSLFEGAPEGDATRRLHHLLGTLDLKGTAVENWKLKVASAEAAVERPR